jgi:hypothetical protein
MRGQPVLSTLDSFHSSILILQPQKEKRMATVDIAKVPVEGSPLLLSTPFTNIVPGAAVPPSVLNSHEADARGNSERVRCFWAHVPMPFFSILIIGVGVYQRFSTLPLALVALGTSTFALSRLWSLRHMASGCCCLPLGPYSCIFGLNIAVMVFAVPTLGVCLWFTGRRANFGDSELLAYSLTAAFATFAIIVCSILALLEKSLNPEDKL